MESTEAKEAEMEVREKAIMALDKHKFAFLQTNDPYHPYYRHKLSEGLTQPSVAAIQPQTQQQIPVPAVQQKFDKSQFIKPKIELVPPEPEKFILRPIDEGMGAQDLDVIKLTAQFAALNGTEFVKGLASREHASPQFNFLRPTHGFYGFYMGLVEAYSRVLLPSEDILRDLKGRDSALYLKRCVQRLEWDKSQEKARQQAEDDEEHERAVMSSIPWDEAVLVETIDFLDEEDDSLPAPGTLEEIIRGVKALLTGAEVVPEMEAVEMEIDNQHIQEGIQATEELVGIVLPGDEGQDMCIVKNYKRPEERLPETKKSQNMVVSPITGELIPVDQMEEHTRVSLIDPKYKEQKEKMLAKQSFTTLARDDEICGNISKFSSLRPDIFGTTEQEISKAVDRPEVVSKEPVMWDGHTGSINRVTSRVETKAPKLQTIPVPPQPVYPPLSSFQPPPVRGSSFQPPPVRGSSFQPPPVRGSSFQPPPVSGSSFQLPTGPGYPGYPVYPGHQPYGLVPGMMQPQNPISYEHFHPPPPPPPEEPSPKRPKMDNLVPEQDFCLQFPDPVTFLVNVPSVENDENLKGQTIEVTTLVSDTISGVKDKLAARLGIPAKKQKISGVAGFFKDNETLARYNVGPGAVLNLSLKDRAGKKH